MRYLARNRVFQVIDLTNPPSNRYNLMLLIGDWFALWVILFASGNRQNYVRFGNRELWF